MKTKHVTLLILRLLVGGMLAYSGIMKLLNMPAITEYFAGMGITSPIVVWAVAIGETLAGLGMVFGVYTQLAAAGAAIIMAGAVYYSAIYATSTEVRTTAILLIASVILMYTGSGKIAIKPCPVSIKDIDPVPAPTPTPSTSNPVVPPTNPTV